MELHFFVATLAIDSVGVLLVRWLVKSLKGNLLKEEHTMKKKRLLGRVTRHFVNRVDDMVQFLLDQRLLSQIEIAHALTEVRKAEKLLEERLALNSELNSLEVSIREKAIKDIEKGEL